MNDRNLLKMQMPPKRCICGNERVADLELFAGESKDGDYVIVGWQCTDQARSEHLANIVGKIEARGQSSEARAVPEQSRQAELDQAAHDAAYRFQATNAVADTLPRLQALVEALVAAGIWRATHV